MNTQILWILTILIFLIIEICTVSLVSIWFCVGAAFAEIASLCHLNFIIQLILFLTISFLAMLFIMPAVWKKIKRTRKRTNADSLIGQTGIVTEEINGMKNTGRAMVNGSDWMARSKNPAKSILVGTKVTVKKIEGAKLIVESIFDEN